MSDMLVKLYAIDYNFNPKLSADGITVKKACILDRELIINFVRENFKDSPSWPHECEYALFNSPISCYIAVQDGEIIGFACYDATAKGFFGPMGVKESCRKSGVGAELLYKSLYSMKEGGYAYAIIGWTAPDAAGFYKKCVNAVEIEDSPPNKSIYKNSVSQN